ncbi:putative hydrolase of the HAD superfamily [Halobiforma haloterrestris]|uniref:Putative hydrolase of the HAD superfamily n=1 Tax=Natronobacterium haloterrestre TaxID=148448 RepID=A0A1I1JBV9_NATHA|nr:HAD family hydrolase [Halobiforma haloterrestris]SFC45865.1 putative hydrolase of the HAD superfamily [Halobiforma haloterrestris]
MSDATDPDGYDAVFWDIGGVLLDLESVGRAHAAFVDWLCDRYDLETDREEAVEAWRAAVGQHFREREGTAFRSAREGYAKGVAAVVGEQVPESAWKPAFDERVRGAIEPVPGAVEAVERLAATDYHVGVVSDVDDCEGKRILETFGIRDRFDSITTSEAVGRTKPDPAIFETALEKAEIDPERALMVGDRYDHDVAGADAAGMDGVAFGAEDGPAVAYRIDSPLEVLEILGVDDE